MISTTINITPPDLAARLASIPQRVLDPEFRRMVLEAEANAKLNVTGGNPLRVQTGRLRSSINSRVEQAGLDLRGRLGSNVKYARIHELGGVIPAHRVVPVTAKALRFFVNGQVVFARYADIPAITMPERPYLRPAAQKAIVGMVDRLSKVNMVKA